MNELELEKSYFVAKSAKMQRPPKRFASFAELCVLCGELAAFDYPVLASLSTQNNRLNRLNPTVNLLGGRTRLLEL